MVLAYFCAPTEKNWGFTGRSVARLSRLVWDQEVASSNLAAPTPPAEALAKAGFFIYSILCQRVAPSEKLHWPYIDDALIYTTLSNAFPNSNFNFTRKRL